MRVLHLAPRLGTRGGADQCLLSLLGRQTRRHRVVLAVGRREGGPALPCEVREVPALASRVRDPADLERLHDAVRPEVVHIHNVVNPAVLEWGAGHDAWMTVQDHRFFCPGQGKWTRDGTVCRDRMQPEICASCFQDAVYFAEVHALTEARLAALRALRVVVLSRYMREELVSAGVPAARVSVVPPFVDGLPPAESPAGKARVVLFAGRLVRAKGVPDAVEAWRRSGVDRPLVFAGTGTLRQTLERAGHEVLGWLDRPALARAYARADALLLPSRWQEPFGLTGLEALSFGVPVVAWDSGGVREWHPGGDLLVPWGDVSGLGRALARAVGRRAAPPEGFEPERAIAALDALYAG